jgi:hypothetical protein
MVEIEKLLLRVDVGGEEDSLGVELVYEHNIGQEYSGEGGEEVLVAKVEHLEVELCRSQTNNDFDMEGED